MSTIMITMKEGAKPEEFEKVKKAAIDQGGEIVHESTLIKSIHVKFPKDKVHSLATNEHVTVETDKEVKTQ